MHWWLLRIRDVTWWITKMTNNVTILADSEWQRIITDGCLMAVVLITAARLQTMSAMSAISSHLSSKEQTWNLFSMSVSLNARLLALKRWRTARGTHDAAACRVDEDTLARRQAAQLEEQDVGHQVVHGDCSSVQVAEVTGNGIHIPRRNCN